MNDMRTPTPDRRRPRPPEELSGRVDVSDFVHDELDREGRRHASFSMVGVANQLVERLHREPERRRTLVREAEPRHQAALLQPKDGAERAAASTAAKATMRSARTSGRRAPAERP